MALDLEPLKKRIEMDAPGLWRWFSAADVRALIEEVERLRAALVEDEEAASARIFVAEAEVERLRAALAVYADHENWGVVIPTDLAIPEPRARPRLWRYGRYGWDVAEAALRGDNNAGETGLPRP